MKPDWNNAPEWATHIALDPDGRRVWVELEPSRCLDGNWFHKLKREQIVEPRQGSHTTTGNKYAKS